MMMVLAADGVCNNNNNNNNTVINLEQAILERILTSPLDQEKLILCKEGYNTVGPATVCDDHKQTTKRSRRRRQAGISRSAKQSSGDATHTT